jgi:hypothetical protein
MTICVADYTRTQSLLLTFARSALRAKIGPDEAESEGCGGSTVEDDNKVWRIFRRNPKGRGQFSPFLRRSSLADTRYASLLASRTEKNWRPAPTVGKLITGSRREARVAVLSTGYSRLNWGSVASRRGVVPACFRRGSNLPVPLSVSCTRERRRRCSSTAVYTLLVGSGNVDQRN